MSTRGRLLARLLGVAAMLAGSLVVGPAPAEAAWSGWREPAGYGRTYDAPAITTTSDGSVWVVVRGTDDRVYFNRLRASQWSGWIEVPGGRTTWVAPAVTGDPYGDLNIVVRGTDNRIWIMRWYGDTAGNGSWDTSWRVLVNSTTPTLAPAVLWNHTRYRLETYVRQAGNGLYRCYGYSCSGWTALDGGGATPSSPAAGWWPGPPSGYGYLVVRGTDNRLWRTTKTYSVAFGTDWWTWHSTFTTPEAPGVAVDTVGNLDVVALGATDNQVYLVRPSTITRIGTFTSTSAPAAAHTAYGLCVVATSMDNRIYYNCDPSR
ncbi:MAG TPA: hypothetical protein VFR67_28445 [Pilimelia sp.]|nr:hypothetical protein [Pilimelia sp.]